METEVMEFDVIIVGAGPAGLAAACRLKQRANAQGRELSVCVLEKGAEIGAHSVSGAVFDTRALDELFPNWVNEQAPVTLTVSEDSFHWLLSENTSLRIPAPFVPKSLHNQTQASITVDKDAEKDDLHDIAQGKKERLSPNYLISEGVFCRWLGKKAEQLGVDIFSGFAAQSLIIENERVQGVVTGALGVAADGSHKRNYVPGMELRARHTLFAEGSRGHLGKQLIAHFGLDTGTATQHYGIGLKEIWEIPAAQHRAGKVMHGGGWPLIHHRSEAKPTTGGWFLYHLEDCRVAIGLIVDLNYCNPWLSPFDEFQRMKQHPLFSSVLREGERIGYASRTLTKGGPEALPNFSFPGGALLGCNAGTLDVARLKGIHMAMKSGMIAADTLLNATEENYSASLGLNNLNTNWANSWAGKEHARGKGFNSALHKLGPLAGGAWNLANQWLGGKLPTFRDDTPDHASLQTVDEVERIHYPRPDNTLSFDRASSVQLANVYYEENQPSHLILKDSSIPIRDNLPRYGEPATRYCPAGVYEVLDESDGPVFRINFQNCIQCKTCDIKDPAQNIIWTPAEGGNGPHYGDM
ncbi:Electron transfer flavoprotein-ubiquinone oxidoreductase [Halomonadaceae bacterium LMG 33818]|uniref:electron transfer flavoprotein-ubiquinone oxidoreductase n=1 Tax=Cernens ardua TaxID=3402176 RepID=UPI003EDC76C6